MKLTLDQLKQIVPTLPKNADVFIPYLNEAIKTYEINTPRRLAGFLANAAHETMGFKRMVEMASGDAYENRKDLGNVYPGDGRRYKGRGIFQVTGRNNYVAMGKAMGIPNLASNPDLLMAPQYAVKSAGIFWVNIKGNGLMDLPDTWRSKTLGYDPFRYLVYRVNGGQNGYAERLEYFNRALKVLAQLLPE
jgi:putative chitinase